MAQLRLTCFQSLAITLNDEPVPFRSAKGRALLIYLAVEQGRAHTRAALAGLLWPDLPEARARQNLSQTLLEVRKAIGDTTATPPFFEIAPQSIAFQPRAAHWLDTAQFTTAIANQDYRQAASLYQGEFLTDFFIADSDLWEEWVTQQRERYRQQAVDAFFQVGSAQEAEGHLEDALATVRQLLELMPWHEEAHALLMRLLAQNGQRSAALAQYDLLTTILMDEFGVGPTAQTDELYDQIVAGTVTAAPRPSPQNTFAPQHPPPFQAPLLLPHFVGRNSELQTIEHSHQTAEQHIYAIVGMGGVGKTSLATQLAHTLRDRYHDGVLWANPLASNPLDILASWATAYGHNFSQLTDLGSRAAAIRGVLAERQALIVIDNVERVGEIEALLPSGGACTVIITTRDLDVATALNAQTIRLQEFREGEALALLRHIIGDARVDAEIAAAVELCTLCGDLPLAVEIAAQRLKSRQRMTLAQMVARLGDQQQRLNLQISDRAVRTSFAVSWEALNTEQRTIFASLAVFAGRSFTVDAVTYIADADAFAVEDALYTLETLSLVRGAGDAAEDRYTQHPLLADFAREKAEDLATTMRRFTDYSVQFVHTHRDDLAQLEPEWENLLAAIDCATTQERWQLVLKLSDLLHQPWFGRGRYSDARAGFANANRAASAVGDEMTLAYNLLRWGEACLEQNDYAEAEQHLQQSLDDGMRLEEDTLVATAEFHLARLAIDQSRYTEAEARIDHSLAIWLAVEDEKAYASAQFRKARLFFDRNELNAAETLLREALGRQEKVVDTRGMVPTLRLLAQIAAKGEEYTVADRYCEQAQQYSEALQDEGELATVHYTRAILLRRQGKYDAARQAAEAALPSFHHLGLRRLEGMVSYQLSVITKELGEYEQALQHNRHSIAIFDEVQNQLGKLFCLVLLGDLYQILGDAALATNAWQDAHMLATTLNHQSVLAQLQARLPY